MIGAGETGMISRRQELGFLVMNGGAVLTVETLLVTIEEIDTVCVRVSRKAKDGRTRSSGWFLMGMDERSALARMARRLKATLHYVGTCDG